MYVNEELAAQLAVHKRDVFGTVNIPVAVCLEFPRGKGKSGTNRSGDHCKSGSGWRTAEATPSLATPAAIRSAVGVP